MIEELFSRMTDRELRNFMTILVFGTIGLALSGYHLLKSRIKRYEFLANARLKDQRDRTDEQLLFEPVKEFLLLLGFLIVCVAAFLYFALD